MRSLYAILLVNLQGNARYLYWTLFHTMNDLKKVNLMWGKSWEMRPKPLRELRRLTCLICFGYSIAESTNDLRYHLFLKKRKKIFSAATSMRKCSFYQADIWRKWLQARRLFPINKVADGSLKNMFSMSCGWMSGLPTSEALLNQCFFFWHILYPMITRRVMGANKTRWGMC